MVHETQKRVWFVQEELDTTSADGTTVCGIKGVYGTLI